jgi:hypothetical protein
LVALRLPRLQPAPSRRTQSFVMLSRTGGSGRVIGSRSGGGLSVGIAMIIVVSIIYAGRQAIPIRQLQGLKPDNADPSGCLLSKVRHILFGPLNLLG